MTAKATSLLPKRVAIKDINTSTNPRSEGIYLAIYDWAADDRGCTQNPVDRFNTVLSM